MPAGIALAALSGVLQGAVLVPMKFARAWKWENIWLIFAACGYFVLPWIFAAVSVPALSRVYAAAGLRPAIVVFLFGLGWGVSAVLFGLACDALGIALGFALILGLGTAGGSLIPLAMLSPEKFFQSEGIHLMAGVAIMIAGVVVCAWAGKLRAERSQPEAAMQSGRRSFSVGLTLALVSGVLNPLVNLALLGGADLTRAAVALGTRPQFAPNVLWSIIGTAAFIPNAAYCGYLLRVNRTGALFRKALHRNRNVLLALLMGVVWMGGMGVYGSSTVYLGELGPSLGWPVFMAFLIASSNLAGVLLGEWRGGGKPLMTMYVGVALLVASVLVIGLGARAKAAGREASDTTIEHKISLVCAGTDLRAGAGSAHG